MADRSGWFCSYHSSSEWAPLIQNSRYLIFFSGRLEKRDLEECKNLQFIQLLTAGTDMIDIPTVKEMNIVVADNNGANATAVAEHTVLLILAALKKLLMLHSNVLSSKWQGPPPFLKDLIELKGKTVGIVGFGRIGQKVAQRLNGFEANLQYCDVRDIEIQEHISIKRVSQEVLLKTSDIITLHVPLTRETFHMINEQVLSLMKSGVVIINTSRGMVVDEKALIDAVRIGKVGSIGLDVFEDEPLRTKDLFVYQT